MPPVGQRLIQRAKCRDFAFATAQTAQSSSPAAWSNPDFPDQRAAVVVASGCTVPASPLA